MAFPPMTNSGDFLLEAPCARVFPLFTAQGERRWADGWNPEMLSGEVQRGSVFRTFAHADKRETVWIVADYQPEQYRVSYARIAQDSNMGLVDVACRERPGNGSRITVRYTLTPLNEAGEGFVRHFLSNAHYSRFIEEWRTALTAALKNE